MKIITDNSEKVKLNSPIPVGKKVKVTYGPFKGLEGTVIHERNASRLTVLFDSITQAVSVEINPEYLKKLK
jgi:transcription antitermination factor NusG